MKSDEATRIVNDLQSKRIFQKDEVESYLDSNNLVKSKDDMVEVIYAVLNQNGLFPELVESQLADCASSFRINGIVGPSIEVQVFDRDFDLLYASTNEALS